MKIQEFKEAGAMKKLILALPFGPLVDYEPDVAAYPAGAVCAAIPAAVNARDLLNTIDNYTPGNSEAIVSSAPIHYGKDADCQRLIMQPEMVNILKANLRTDTCLKRASTMERK